MLDKSSITEGPDMSESWLMKIALYLGCEKLAWSLRRLHCPVDKTALVLEIGSGGNPYYRANVLLDAYESTSERHWVPLVSDRPTVLAFAESLPFKDKVFDFIIASHVLEHSRDPRRFLEEMQRVAKSGYIEVPDAFMERINPYPDHRLEITNRHGKLVIRKKKEWQVDPDVVELYEDRVKEIITKQVIPIHPFAFHVRYYWQDEIHFEILNPDFEMKTHSSQPQRPPSNEISLKEVIHAKLLSIIRRLFSQHRRNSRIDLTALLRCPDCHADEFSIGESLLFCRHCEKKYSLKNDIFNLTGYEN